MVNYKTFYEHYHRRRLLPKRLISNKNFTYRHILKPLNQYCLGTTVIDCGSGVGSLSLYLANKGKNVTGIEISQKAVNIANQSAIKFKLNNQVKFLRQDLLKVKFRRKYNFAICSEVLEHLPNDDLVIEKLNHLLLPKGRLLISTPSMNAPLIKFGVIRHFDAWSGHLRRYTTSSLSKLLKKHGFYPIYIDKNEGLIRNALFVFPKFGSQIIRLANRFPIISNLLTVIDNIFLRLFGESQIIIVAKVVRKS